MSMVKFGDDGSYIKFEFLEANAPLPYGFDICCAIEARCGAFSGLVRMVFFPSYHVRAFLEDLRTLPYSPGDFASLYNYGSWTKDDSFKFSIYYPPEAEHLVVTADLSWPIEIGDASHDLKVSVAFPLTPYEVSTARETFHKIVFG